eukprot:7986256-Alexandrium_andersonii.AAC.1
MATLQACPEVSGLTFRSWPSQGAATPRTLLLLLGGATAPPRTPPKKRLRRAREALLGEGGPGER